MSELQPTAAKRLIQTFCLGNFAVGMGAFLVIGILSPMAAALGLSAPEGAMLMTAYAFAYALLSPLLVALWGDIDRRTMLAAGLLIVAVAAALAALSTSTPMLYAARVLAAVGAGLFTPVATSVAFSIAPPEQRGRALATVFLGITLASALGLPVGSFIGYTFGWQAGFVVVAGLTTIALATMLAIMPTGLPFRPSSLATLSAALTDGRCLLSVLVTMSFTGAGFLFYTFIGPLLEQSMGFGRDGIALTLTVAGAGGVAGGWIAGRLADSLGARAALKVVMVARIAATVVFSFLPLPVAAFVVAIFGWAVLGAAFIVPQQARLIQQMPDRQPVLLALNAACIYLGAAFGPLLGAQIVEAYGLSALGIASSLAFAFALGHLLLSERFPPLGGLSNAKPKA